MSKKPKVCPVSPSDHASVSVRQIDNGYITSRSSYTNGEYHNSEIFSAEKPKVSLSVSDEKAPKVTPRARASNPLSSAMKHLK